MFAVAERVIGPPGFFDGLGLSATREAGRRRDDRDLGRCRSGESDLASANGFFFTDGTRVRARRGSTSERQGSLAKRGYYSSHITLPRHRRHFLHSSRVISGRIGHMIPRLFRSRVRVTRTGRRNRRASPSAFSKPPLTVRASGAT